MVKRWNVAHFIRDDADGTDKLRSYGVLEIEEMHYEVRQAETDCREAHADGGVFSGPSPEEVADKYRRMVERVPVIEDQHGRMVELLRRILKLNELFGTRDDSVEWVRDVHAVLREIDANE